MRARRAVRTLLVAALATPAAMAQPPASSIPAAPPRTVMVVPPCAPPPGFPAWGRNHTGVAPIWLARDPTPELLLGDTAYLPLSPVADLRLAAPLDKPAPPGDRAGLVTVRIADAGIYRVALGARAWIDMVRGSKPVPSVAHQMGTPCSGIAKMVDFALEPGLYTIQVSGSVDPTLRIAIARRP